MRRLTALLEVLGVYLAAGALEDNIVKLLVRWRVAAPASPFDLLTAHTTNAELLLATHRTLLIWLLQYGSYFLLIFPLNWWYRRRGPRAYGLTRAGHTWGWLLLAGLAAAVLSEGPALVHGLVDAVHPLGATVPWRQALSDMSWHRWQFWLFEAVLSYGMVPVLEELLFRGYYQRRLAEDWGDAPAILGTSCLFVFAHRQYLVANVYNITMVAILFCFALGLGIVFAYTRSLVPSMIAHAIVNIPTTPKWKLAMLILFVPGFLIAFRAGKRAVNQVFKHAPPASCVLLAVVCALYVLISQRVAFFTTIGVVFLVAAVVLEWMQRARRSSAA